MRKGSTFLLLHVDVLTFPALCVENSLLSPSYGPGTSSTSIDHSCEGFFLGSQFHFFHLCACPHTLVFGDSCVSCEVNQRSLCLEHGCAVRCHLAGLPGDSELPQLRLRVTSGSVAQTLQCQQHLLRRTVLQTHDATLGAVLLGVFEVQVSTWLLLLERGWDRYIFCPKACV